jgi:hypothetical protein
MRALVQRGTYWAALEAVPLLSHSELSDLESTIRAGAVFTRHQQTLVAQAIRRRKARRNEA